MKSKLCEFLQTTKNWRDVIKEAPYKVIYNQIDDLIIFNYSMKSDFKNPIVRESRGIIVRESEDNEYVPVCWAFNKFSEYNESYSDLNSINWDTARAESKIDGSIMKLWFDDVKSKWIVSTNSQIYAEDAKISETFSGEDNNFYFYFIQALFNSIGSSLTMESDQDIAKIKEEKLEKLNSYFTSGNYHKDPYTDLSFLIDDIMELEKGPTYVYEVYGPINQVVCEYRSIGLIFIGQRNLNGEEVRPSSYFIPLPDYIPVNSLECIKSMAKSIKITTSDGNGRILEGFVVVDENFNRIKVKTDIWFFLHASVSSSKLTNKSARDILSSFFVEKTVEGSLERDAGYIIANYKFDVPAFSYYLSKYTEFMNNVIRYMNTIREYYISNNKDFSLVGKRVANNPTKYFVFKYLRNPDVNLDEDINPSSTIMFLILYCEGDSIDDKTNSFKKFIANNVLGLYDNKYIL